MIRMHQVLVCLMAIVIDLFFTSEVDSYSSEFHGIGCHRPTRCGRRRRCPVICEPSGSTELPDIYRKLALCVSVNPEVWCTRFSFDGEWLRRTGKSWQIPLKNDSNVAAVDIEIDKAGNAFVGMIDSQQLHFFIYNKDNELLGDFDFGKIEKKYNYDDVKSIRLGNEFCLAEMGHSGSVGQADRRVVNKCLDVSKYVNATS